MYNLSQIHWEISKLNTLPAEMGPQDLEGLKVTIVKTQWKSREGFHVP
jgi:hypothetical protein